MFGWAVAGLPQGNGRGGGLSDDRIARARMVTEQLVRRGIKEAKVLQAMSKVPRHLFVDETLRFRAYDDSPLPIGEGQTMSQPYMVALMTEALELQGYERTLEVGTGSGYQTAILAELVHRVWSIERLQGLADRAAKVLKELGYSNITIKVGDGSLGWPEEAPFDAILVTAGAPDVPPALLSQLADNGRLVIPVGDAHSQVLKRFVRRRDSYSSVDLVGCAFVKLVGEQAWQE